MSVSLRRLAAGAAGIGLLLSAGIVAVTPALAESTSVGDDGTIDVGNTDSSMTKSGDGQFANLKVTLSQTKDLVNQVIRISWEGGTPTKPDFGNLGINYLQIMQCWGGTEQDGPSRENCQYGAQRAWNGGQNTNSRQMTTSGIIDPEETKYEEYKDGPLSYVPFNSWTGKTTTGNRSEFFDRNTSNEVDHARIRPDGSGEEYFEVQTGVEAPGLGCGQIRDGESPLCWIVVVPRGDTEVDGTPRGTTTGDPLDTSPLLASNWKNRIVFPLSFQPIGQACPIGRTEIPLLGSDRVAEAITRWQPSLCAAGDSNYSFTVLGDDAARQKLQSPGPDMVFVNDPIPPDAVSPTQPVVYAPVALSGVTISFNLESQSSTLAADEIRRKDGERLTGIKLSQRLVAKLLTQTYRFDAAPDASKVEKNPWDLVTDPEFLALNPQFKDLRIPAVGHLLVSGGMTDTARIVWDWILADKEARAFLEGKADPWGTKINPSYKSTSYPRTDFPRADNECVTYPDRSVPVCTFDLFPYANDLYASARAASRGDTLASSVWDPTAIPPAYKKAPPQEPGRRAVIAITDTALTARFALNAALLRNSAGEYVAPTREAIEAAATSAKKTAVPSVVQPDPAAKTKGAYPLASYTYAATAPSAITKAVATEYARFLTFAAGDGQQLGDAPGQLPAGFAPLPEAMQAQTAAAAAQIVKAAGVPVKDPGGDTGGGGDNSGSGDSGTTDSGTTDSGTTDSGTTDSGTWTDTSGTDTSTDTSGGSTDASGGQQASDPAPSPSATTEAPVTDDSTVAVAAVALPPTPQNPVGAIRYLAIALLLAGGIALLVGAILGQRLLHARPAATSPVADPRRTP